jgi:hypothetical protein
MRGRHSTLVIQMNEQARLILQQWLLLIPVSVVTLRLCIARG